MKEYKKTEHKSTFLAYFLYLLFWTYFAIYIGSIGSRQKKTIILFHQIYFITLQIEFGTVNYVFMLHMTHILIFMSSLKKNHNKWGPCEKFVFWDIFTVFKKNIFFLNNSIEH